VKPLQPRTRRRGADVDEERFRALVQHAPDIIALFDRDGVVSYASPALSRILGHDPDDLTGFAKPDVVHVEDLEVVASALADAIEAPGHPVQVEFRAQHRDGSFRWLEATFTNLFDVASVDSIVINARDVTEARTSAAALAHQALHDPLTDLPNRALFVDRVAQALARARRTGMPIAVLFLDLDRFSEVNASLGNDAGDEVLFAVAQLLESAVRAGDTVARIGGDEFVVCCEDVVDEVEALQIAERLRNAISGPFGMPDCQFCVTPSIGIAFTTPGPEDTPDTLLREADAAMYRAKQRGRDCCELFDQEMRERASSRTEAASALARALDAGEITVHYQPVVAMATGMVVGLEALARWDDPRRGRIGPNEFIPVAEESGLIVPLGAVVLETACRQTAQWNRVTDGPPLALAVNLSVAQLCSPDLADMVAMVLRRSGIAPELLCLEITESVLMEDASVVGAGLEAVKRLGVRIGVDDFGTGYSSLVYLRRFPVDILKVDRSFVSGMTDSEADAAIVAGVVGLAQALGLDAIAEGVETEAQQAALAALGCPLGQGFLWSRPLPWAELRPWLEADRWRPRLHMGTG
jgi:diguanylate cyclase (GGDEF)-like protein/PAS domain S-box-containing protein